MSYFTVDIYTPNKIIAKGVPANSLIVPTTRGEINVLPEHTHMVTKLDTGVLRCIAEGVESDFLMTTGIIKVLKNKVTVLAQVAEPKAEIDGERAAKALNLAQSKLSGSETLNDADLEKYRRKMTRAFIRSELSQK